MEEKEASEIRESQPSSWGLHLWLPASWWGLESRQTLQIRDDPLETMADAEGGLYPPPNPTLPKLHHPDLQEFPHVHLTSYFLMQLSTSAWASCVV